LFFRSYARQLPRARTYPALVILYGTMNPGTGSNAELRRWGWGGVSPPVECSQRTILKTGSVRPGNHRVQSGYQTFQLMSNDYVGIALFGFFASIHHTAKNTGGLGIQRFFHGGIYGSLTGVGNRHAHPGKGLQHHPMQAKGKGQHGNTDRSCQSLPHHGLLASY